MDYCTNIPAQAHDVNDLQICTFKLGLLFLTTLFSVVINSSLTHVEFLGNHGNLT